MELPHSVWKILVTVFLNCIVSFYRLAAAEEEVRLLRSKSGLLADYQTEIRRLRDDIALLSARRDVLTKTPDISSYERTSWDDKLRYGSSSIQ